MTDFGVGVGVLLPVRLETRLDTFPPDAEPPDRAGHTRLRVLVVPDVPSFDSHDPTVRADELDLVDATWRDAGGDLGGPGGTAAFLALAAAVGPARAAFLLRRFPAVAAGGTWRADRTSAVLREQARWPVLRGIPGYLELYALLGSDPVQLAAWQPPHSERDGVLAQPADVGDATGWGPSWVAAAASGLTAVLDLDDVPGRGRVDPVEIDALVVLGLSAQSPTTLFGAHADGGGLELTAPGTAAASVHGAATTDRDPRRWLSRVAGGPSPSAAAVSGALCGDAAVLGPLPGGETQHDEGQADLLAATWPALAGHALQDLWTDPGEDPDAAPRWGDWVARWVRPEGPLPPVLVRGQPYGLLPVTTLAHWDGRGGEERLERVVAALVRAQAPTAARRAEESLGTVVGASADRAYELIAQVPRSSGYATRTMLRLDVLADVWQDPDLADRARSWWDGQTRQLLQDPLSHPRHPMVALGWPWPLRLPLLAPAIDVPGPALESLFEQGLDKDPDAWHRDLLLWLLEHTDSSREQTAEFVHMLQERGRPDSLLFRLCLLSMMLVWSEVVRSTAVPRSAALTDGEPDLLARLTAGFGPAPPSDVARTAVDATLRGIKGLAYGTDPAAAVERRLRGVLDTATGRRLDVLATALPWRRLSTGPWAAADRGLGMYGWVDRPFRGGRDPGPAAGGVLLAPSDAQARTAAILRDRAVHDTSAAVEADSRWEMRLTSAQVGLAADLVAEVRGGAHPSEALGRKVEEILGTYGTVSAARDAWRIRPEHAGRRTCDGLRVLQLTDDVVQATVGPLTADQLHDLAELRRVTGTLADVLLAQGVWDVVQGGFGQAGAATDAAAGLAMPPDLRALRTERGSTSRRTAVVVVLPDADAPADARAASPVTLADPAVATWLTERTSGSSWTWSRGAAAVGIDELGLTPVDCLALSDDDLVRLATERLGGAPTSFPDGPRAIRREAAALHCNPLSRNSIRPDDAAPDPDPLDPAPELRARYARLRAAAVGLAAELAAAAAPVDLLRRAARWGIAPTPEAVVDPADPTDPELARLLSSAATTLAARLTTSPEPAATADLTAAQLLSAIAELAVPGGRVPVLCRAASGDLPPLLPCSTDASGRPDVDRLWLEIVSAVRPRLAVIDAHQAVSVREGRPAWAAWSTRPDDPWQLAPGPQLVLAYGPGGALAAPTVAVGVVDAFAEAVPDSTHTATAAFAFATPASRAPQAILLAVTPQEEERLDSETLLATLLETRELARVRMLRAEDAGLWDAAALGLLPADSVEGRVYEFSPEPEGG